MLTRRDIMGRDMRLMTMSLCSHEPLAGSSVNRILHRPLGELPDLSVVERVPRA